MFKLTDQIKENFPFISVLCYGGAEYIGIIINQDQYVTTIYNYEKLKTDQEKCRLLELGETWWWESNRTIPINIFLKGQMEPFRYSITTLNTKDVTIIIGTAVNLHNLSIKRLKRKTVQLIKST